MKFFHLSDLHIGLKLVNHDMQADQAYILQKIAEQAAVQQPDAIVIAGDVYDKAVPSAEAVGLFDDFLTALVQAVPNAEIMVISGNHDSAQRINAFRQILGAQHIHMIGLPPMQSDEHIEKVTLQDEFGQVNFYLLPFVKPSMVKAITGTDAKGNNLSYDAAVQKLLAREKIDETERNVLVSHQFYLSTQSQIERMDSEIVTVGNIDAITGDVLERFDYAALGHIHKPQQLNGKECYRYCGTPLACSFSEAGQEKAILSVELGAKGDVTVERLPLKPLHPVRIVRGSLDEVLATPSEDYVRIVLTDKVDFDVLDLQDRLHAAYPNVLEIQREVQQLPAYQAEAEQQLQRSPLELCLDFLPELTAEEQEVLTQVMNQVQAEEATE